jgi:hypothetical protein
MSTTGIPLGYSAIMSQEYIIICLIYVLLLTENICFHLKYSWLSCCGNSLFSWWTGGQVLRYADMISSKANIRFTFHFYAAITSKVKMHLCLEIAASVPYQRPEYSGRVTTQNRQWRDGWFWRARHYCWLSFGVCMLI